jgi:hypothetical protein
MIKQKANGRASVPARTAEFPTRAQIRAHAVKHADKFYDGMLKRFRRCKELKSCKTVIEIEVNRI